MQVTINPQDILREELDKFILEVRERMDDNKKNVSGRARRGFYYEFQSAAVATVYGVPYSNVLQRGIKPRTWPRGLALMIQQWAKDKGIRFGTPKELRNFSHAVAWTIMNKGTVQFRQGKYIDIYDTPFDTCMYNVTDRLGDKVLYDIMNNIGI